ncbi:MAG: acetylxylan esterase [Bacteroides sp.]
MKKICLWSLLMACTLLSVAQIRGHEVRVVVSPNHLDWNYQLGERCTFKVQVWKAQNLLPDVEVDYELGPEMYPTESRQAVRLKDGTLTLQGTLKQPGFLRCRVTAHVDGRTYEGLATAAYRPDQITPAGTMPADFVAYWEKQLADARQTPVQPVLTLMPDRCTATDNVYQVSFCTRAGAGRMYGVLSVPKAEGRYPALLRLPGAGVRAYGGDTYTAPGRLITLEVGIHGVPIDGPQSLYDNLMAGALAGYWTFGSQDRDRLYYNRVVIGALRAVDVLCQLPQYNGQALAVAGSSQGGALSIITAALDSRVTCVAAVHPALCDHEASLRRRACGWPHYFYHVDKPDERQLATVRYYDTAHFAACLKVPGWFSWGYNDTVCPPTSMYAAYNTVTAPKQLSLYLETGHYWYQEQWDEWQEWLRKQLGVE